MSTTTTKTGYRLSINSMNNSVSAMFYADTDDLWSDEFAQSLATALGGLTWPSGGFELDKTTVSTTAYTTDLTTTPPSFT